MIFQLNNIQHGFRTWRSVVNTAVNFIESIMDSVDQREYVKGIFMDLSRAFNSVKISIHFNKLYSLGVTKTALQWFELNITGRPLQKFLTYQQKRVFKISSDLKLKKFGVSKGYILGPILFLCHLKNNALKLSNINKKSMPLCRLLQFKNL